MATIRNVGVWRHLSQALAQLRMLAEGRTPVPDEQRRADEALNVIAEAIGVLAEQGELAKYEVRLLESEVERMRNLLRSKGPSRAGRMANLLAGRVRNGQGAAETPAPVPPVQASFDRLNRVLPSLRKITEAGGCQKAVLDVVQRGIEQDVALLNDPQQLRQLPEDDISQAATTAREVLRHVQTLSVQNEIQAAVDGR